MKLCWPKRPKRDDTLFSRRRVWTTRCKRYRVIHSHILYGGGVLSDRYFSEYFDPHYGSWDLLPQGRHRTKRAAMRHCEQDAERDDGSVN
jgi:hypothetical protein